MTNKYKYFVANWKMFGNKKSINLINKVIKFSKLSKFRKAKIVYCPPYTILGDFIKKLKNTNIKVGAQNCHFIDGDGPYTGFISAKMLKKIGCDYTIIGHSEQRYFGDTDEKINKKILLATKNNLNVFFCVGEKLNEKRKNLTSKVLKNQLLKGLKKVKKLNKLIIAYEPVWSIGSGKIPSNAELSKNIMILRSILKKIKKNFKFKILYGGSVNEKNIELLNKIKNIDGFLIGGSSQKSNKFIDIIKKTYN
tara:strand:+ start:505 stop:1257 length:753 start_codon:yes stop_codon:yes gene_type:complete